jgi:hypothetical protein
MRAYKLAARVAPTRAIGKILGGKKCTFPKYSNTLEYSREWREIGPTKILDASAFEASNGAGKAGVKAGLSTSNRLPADVGRQLLCTSFRLQVRVFACTHFTRKCHIDAHCVHLATHARRPLMK